MKIRKLIELLQSYRDHDEEIEIKFRRRVDGSYSIWLTSKDIHDYLTYSFNTLDVENPDAPVRTVILDAYSEYTTMYPPTL